MCNNNGEMVVLGLSLLAAVLSALFGVFFGLCYPEILGNSRYHRTLCHGLNYSVEPVTNCVVARCDGNLALDATIGTCPERSCDSKPSCASLLQQGRDGACAGGVAGCALSCNATANAANAANAAAHRSGCTITTVRQRCCTVECAAAHRASARFTLSAVSRTSVLVASPPVLLVQVAAVRRTTHVTADASAQWAHREGLSPTGWSVSGGGRTV